MTMPMATPERMGQGSMSDYKVGKINRVRQAPDRALQDRESVHAILDEGYVAHVGFLHDGEQVVIPTFYVRDGEQVLLHGSRKARMFRTLAAGAPLSLCVTLLDGLVLARSGFHHSMNYRSVIVHGRAHELSGAEKARGLDLFVDRIVPGRANEARRANKQEDKATMVLAVPLETVAAKARTGGVNDDPEDLDLPIWAGVIPIETRYGAPIPEPGLDPKLKAPKKG